jgi:HPt (histidine-containing phosphotransfer) domain-containing protein
MDGMSNQSVFAVREALDRVDGDRDLLSELVGIFFSEFESNVSSMRSALDSSDAKTFGRVAHSIKGAAGNIGAVQVAVVALRLEQLAAGPSLGSAAADVERLVRSAEEFRSVFESSRAKDFPH